MATSSWKGTAAVVQLGMQLKGTMHGRAMPQTWQRRHVRQINKTCIHVRHSGTRSCSCCMFLPQLPLLFPTCPPPPKYSAGPMKHRSARPLTHKCIIRRADGGTAAAVSAWCWGLHWNTAEHRRVGLVGLLSFVLCSAHSRCTKRKTATRATAADTITSGVTPTAPTRVPTALTGRPYRCSAA